MRSLPNAYNDYSSLVTDVTGFVAVDSMNQLIVVSFRGSHSLRNFLADFNFIPVSIDICKGCTAHRGFWDSWTEARNNILQATKEALVKYPKYKMVVTGHSLGGAIATLAAAELRNTGCTVALVGLTLFIAFTLLTWTSTPMDLREWEILPLHNMFPINQEATIV